MTTTLASKIEFKKFCEILERITRLKGNAKLEELRRFIDLVRQLAAKLKNKIPDADISMFPLLRLLLPQLERERGPHGLKEKTLANLYIRVFCFGKNSQNAKKLTNYKAPSSDKSHVGDFADCVYWVMRTRLPDVKTSRSIEEINTFLENVAARNAANQSKDQEFQIITREISAFELKWLTRIILKDLRLGMGQKRIFEAFHPDAEDLFDVTSSLRKVCEKLSDPKIRARFGIEIFTHFKPMLLERCKIEEIGKLFGKGDQSVYFVQTKYDGERSQLHMKDGKFKYFTRMGFDISSNQGYGETKDAGFLSRKIASLVNPNCHSIILDGELMGWHKINKKFGSKGMAFDVKKLSPTSHHQPCFVAFDIVMYNDQLLVNLPLKERLKLLDTAFSEEEGVLVKSESKIISKREELLQLFNVSLDNNDEGIVLKRSESLYVPKIREGSGCYKIKAEYSDGLVQDIDLVILGGFYGEGKCRGVVNSFLVGAACPPAQPGGKPTEFQSVGAVSSGIAKEKLNELLNKFQEHWAAKAPPGVVGPRVCPPDLWIHPEHSTVLQIRATEIIRCPDHPIGYTLRFPRVMKVRDDKPWDDACTTTQFLSLIQTSGVVQKLTKRHATVEDIDDAPRKKVPRVLRLKEIKIQGSYDEPRASEVVRLTRLFDGKEVCVINGNEKLTKSDVERILLDHGARVVKNAGPSTFCVIVGDPKKVKPQILIKSERYDVANLDWLMRVTQEENWSALQDWFPWELFSASEPTRHRLFQLYDIYYDSFTCEADENSLSRSLEMSGKASEVAITLDECKELDKELFEEGVSPFSVFRGVAGFFDDPMDCRKYEFRFMDGIVEETIHDKVTRVFLDENIPQASARYKDAIASKRGILKLVRSQWIEDCFKERRLLPDTEYMLEVS
ncbi:DNA ligase 4 [Orussus abietinus]|uniref:DNA ligase 4 n=1 Tax=Orussus abietinus TaxID=222816 RepID=UPI000625243A|nr:DNA ligase 4 [Orussus abietinus]XP_012285411.1 DNA ligase 4 [Orussus abietinus]